MDKEDIRVGRVSAVNYEAGTISVVYEDRDGSVTKDIPMLSHEYMMLWIGWLTWVSSIVLLTGKRIIKMCSIWMSC